MKSLLFVFAACCSLLLSSGCEDARPRVSDYDVIWDSPSTDASGSMPLGNGELGVNLWVEAGGDLLFYLSRTDSWSETGRLLKLGKVRVSLSPNPFAKNTPFTQRLNLHDGRIEIEAGENAQRVRLSIFADPDHDVLHVTGISDQPLSVTASSEPWRTAPYDIPLQDSLLNIGTEWPRTGTYDYSQVIESADLTGADPGAVVWYHRNEHTVYDLSLEHQQLESIREVLPDPLLHRTFGIYMKGDRFVKTDPLKLQTEKPLKHFTLKLASLTAQTPDAATWEQEVAALWNAAPGPDRAELATSQYWNDYWKQSWIYVETPGSDAGQRITRSYLLQSWITASAGRGNYPIKFNGTIFTVDPRFTDPKIQANVDFRLWGGHYWWQNTRLPYYSMLAGGHTEMMRPLFSHYQNLLPSFQIIAREYFGAEGAVLPETSSIFGIYRNQDYGWERGDLKKGEIQNRYIRHIWNSGLEYLSMMLDYYDYTGDKAFVGDELLPMSAELLRYFQTKFPIGADGKMNINFTQSLETYWEGVQNDLPSVAGLQAVLTRLLELPGELTSAEQRSAWEKMLATVPALPEREVDEKMRFVPAAAYDPKKNNVEVPELYSVFPFWLTHLGTEDRQVGIDTYEVRPFRGPDGWRQDGEFSALLGLTDEARENLLGKIENKNPNFRFPAIWGPNYDWTPDQDHGGNLMETLQLMVLQSHGQQVYLLPAWPADWNVDFKLHVRGGGIVTGSYRDGAWASAPRQKGGTPVEFVEKTR